MGVIKLTHEQRRNIKQFNTLTEIKTHYQNNFIDDCFILKGDLYYMEGYDLKGEYIYFTSIEADANIYFQTYNRYESKKDLTVNLYKGIYSLRNDITHYYFNKIHDNLINMFN